MTTHSGVARINSPRQVLFASLIGTTIEFFDFYIYATHETKDHDLASS